MADKQNIFTLLVAAATRNLAAMFPAFAQTSPKHRHWFDFGYPDTVTFEQFYTMYKRNGIARAGVCRPVEKTWQDNPWILEKEEVHDETTLEVQIRQMMERLDFWGKLKTADERARVGRYGGFIYRFADNKKFKEPVDTVGAGLDGLVELIPFYEGQMKVLESNTDETSPDYGKPTKWEFTEASPIIGQTQNRKIEVHPDRVHIWSPDGSIHGDSCLEPGYNHLVDLEKVMGAGGEGFWKNAKSAPIMNLDKEADINKLATALGVETSEIADKLDEVVADFQKGFDQNLLVQGMDVKTLGVTLPSPEHFLAGPLQAFAASIPIPLKILLGSQTGERASTEDAKEFDASIMSRRSQMILPNIRRILERLIEVGILKDHDWFIDWSDLTESSMDEKVERLGKMADAQQKLLGTGERIFTGDELREVVDMLPLEESEKGLEMPDNPDEVDPEQQNNILQMNARKGRKLYLVHKKAA